MMPSVFVSPLELLKRGERASDVVARLNAVRSVGARLTGKTSAFGAEDRSSSLRPPVVLEGRGE